eukprot:GHVR01120455.1.p1 GENE.GHVR01120455.1~~GHVR01120455.1.p1  ORF type:complete len:305 (-),score=169.52 GHVR01120455.1:3-917(-)
MLLMKQIHTHTHTHTHTQIIQDLMLLMKQIYTHTHTHTQLPNKAMYKSLSERCPSCCAGSVADASPISCKNMMKGSATPSAAVLAGSLRRENELHKILIAVNNEYRLCKIQLQRANKTINNKADELKSLIEEYDKRIDMLPRDGVDASIESTETLSELEHLANRIKSATTTLAKNLLSEESAQTPHTTLGTHTHTHTHPHTHTLSRLHRDRRTHTHTLCHLQITTYHVHVRSHTHTHIHTHKALHIHTHQFVHTHSHSCHPHTHNSAQCAQGEVLTIAFHLIHTHTDTNTHVHTHAHTHTHTQE